MKLITEEMARSHAAEHGVEEGYLYSRKTGKTIFEALEDWDLLDKKFWEKYCDYTFPSRSLKDRWNAVKFRLHLHF